MTKLWKLLTGSLFATLLTSGAIADPNDNFIKALELRKNGNMTGAFEMFQSAAKLGHVEAQVEMGRSYASGMGVPQSFFKAHIWYDIAVTNGSSSAIFGRRHALKNLSEIEVIKAQVEARLCIENNYLDCM